MLTIIDSMIHVSCYDYLLVYIVLLSRVVYKCRTIDLHELLRAVG